jgi:hypothetical protein
MQISGKTAQRVNSVLLRKCSAELPHDVSLGDLEDLAWRTSRQQAQGILDYVGHCDWQLLHRSGRHDFARWKKLHRRAS